jgi:hypothetical protein
VAEPSSVAISVNEQSQKAGQTKKGKKMQPSPDSVTPRYAVSMYSIAYKLRVLTCAHLSRNLCAQDWCAANPDGTTTEFKHYYDHELSAELKKVCR